MRPCILASLLALSPFGCTADEPGDRTPATYGDSDPITGDADGGDLDGGDTDAACTGTPSFTGGSDVEAAVAFCKSAMNGVCGHFDAADAECGQAVNAFFGAPFTAAAQCSAAVEAECEGRRAGGYYEGWSTDPTLVADCLTEIDARTCAEVAAATAADPSTWPASCVEGLVLAPPSPAGCTPITPGTPAIASVDAASPVAYFLKSGAPAALPAAIFCLCLEAGDQVVVSTAAGSISDTLLVLVDPSGLVVASDDDSGSCSGCSRVSHLVAHSGAYLIAATEFNGQQGSFEVLVTVTP